LAPFSALAGPLNPPAGPVNSTYKTLQQVEPRRPISGAIAINEPGSYYLTQNISSPGSIDTITVLADNVTIDLNGFTISGGRTGVNVSLFLPFNSVTIMNGTIAATSGSGIFAGAFDDIPFGLTIRNVKVINPTDLGIDTGRGSIIENCYVRGGAIGIRAGFSSRVSGCTVEFARDAAFSISGGSTITDCLAVGVDNGNNAGDGFLIGAGSTARGLTSRSNAGFGAKFDNECTISDSTFSNNGNAGVRLSAYCRLASSTISTNRNSGVFMDTVVGGVGSLVEHCNISGNVPVGIVSFALGSHTIRDNTITRNADFGVRVDDNCQILNNRIAENGDASTDAGVFITGDGNLVQGNFFSLNVGAGVELFNTSSANLVLANTFRFNSVRTAGTGHIIAPIVNAASAVTGSNPFVNISY
jgi:parallel beta-helix repeat protein